MNDANIQLYLEIAKRLESDTKVMQTKVDDIFSKVITAVAQLETVLKHVDGIDVDVAEVQENVTNIRISLSKYEADCTTIKNEFKKVRASLLSQINECNAYLKEKSEEIESIKSALSILEVRTKTASDETAETTAELEKFRKEEFTPFRVSIEARLQGMEDAKTIWKYLKWAGGLLVAAASGFMALREFFKFLYP